MATNKIVIGLDNRVQSGDQSQQDIVAALAAQGVSNGIAEQVRDPITGKLIQVTLTFPDTASQQALDAVNASRGVASATPPLPPPLFLVDTALLAFSSPLLGDGNYSYGGSGASDNQGIMLSGSELQFASGGSFLSGGGALFGNGVTNSYFDADQASFPVQATIRFHNDHPSTPLTIASGSVVITHDGGQVLALVSSAPVVVPAATETSPTVKDGFESKVYYIGLDGKLYLRHHVSRKNANSGGSETSVAGPFTYAEAVALGAV